jgi:hypothetical protein
MHCSIPFGDGDNKLVSLQEQRHDVPQRPRIDEDLIVLKAFSLNRNG